MSPTSIPAPASYFNAQLLLQPNGVILGLMSGVPDGGHLLQIDLDGGVSRRTVPFVNPILLAAHGSMVIVGRNSPVTLSDISNGARPLATPPTSNLLQSVQRWSAALRRQRQWPLRL